jgi:hypothetical protein
LTKNRRSIVTKKRKTALAAVLALISAGPAKADLVVNGGFETGDFTGWTVNGLGVHVEASGGRGGYAPHTGNFYAALGTFGGLGTLSQTFADTAGQPLTISLWLASNGGLPNEFDVEFNGVTLFNQDNIPTQGYRNLVFDVIATGRDRLLISERDDPDFLALDEVSANSATPASEPVSASLLGTALLSLVFTRRLAIRGTLLRSR